MKVHEISYFLYSILEKDSLGQVVNFSKEFSVKGLVRFINTFIYSLQTFVYLLFQSPGDKIISHF